MRGAIKIEMKLEGMHTKRGTGFARKLVVAGTRHADHE